MKWRRTISLGLAAAMTASTVLAGCGGDSGANGNASSGDNKNQTAATEEGGSQASGDVTTIEVYDVAANYQGMQAGWFGDLVKEKFGLELNIFARQHFIRRDAAPESWVISFFWTMQIIWTA